MPVPHSRACTQPRGTAPSLIYPGVSSQTHHNSHLNGVRDIMTPPLEGTGSRGRRKSHNACLPCRFVSHYLILTLQYALSPLTTNHDISHRRKKSRCPGEKPACSSCTRLNQPCSYALVMSSSSRPGHSVSGLSLSISSSLACHYRTKSDNVFRMRGSPNWRRSSTGFSAETGMH